MQWFDMLGLISHHLGSLLGVIEGVISCALAPYSQSVHHQESIGCHDFNEVRIDLDNFLTWVVTLKQGSTFQCFQRLVSMYIARPPDSLWGCRWCEVECTFPLGFHGQNGLHENQPYVSNFGYGIRRELILPWYMFSVLSVKGRRKSSQNERFWVDSSHWWCVWANLWF